MEQYLAYCRTFAPLLLGVVGVYCLFIWWPPLRLHYRREAIYSRMSLCLALLIAVTLIVWITFCPVPWGTDIDRDWYCTNFRMKELGVRGLRESLANEPDYFWQLYTYGCSQVMSYRVWLLINATIYIGNYLHAAYRLSPTKTVTLFIACICGFAFSSYGISAIRCGIGISFMVLAYTYPRSYWKAVVCMVLAVCFHLTMLIPAVCYIIAILFVPQVGSNTETGETSVELPATPPEKETRGEGRQNWWTMLPKGVRTWVAIWVVCFFISLFFGQAILEALVSRVVALSRFEYMTNPELMAELGIEYRTGFRVDFVAFSLLPMAVAAVYIYVLRYRSQIYSRFIVGYLAANALWLMLIRVPYTDRIAYLSWFLMPFLFFYPLVDRKLNLLYKRAVTGGALFLEVILFSYLL